MKTRNMIIPAALLLATSLSAHALTPGSGNWVRESATYGTPNLRDAFVYVPKNTAPEVRNGKRALMLNLHQCGGSATQVANSFKWEATAEKYGMVVVAPTSPNGSTQCWDIAGTNHQNFNRDSGPLKKLIDSVMSRANLDIDPNQVYVTGFSSGAAQAHILGCMAPGLFSAVGLVHAPPLGISSTQPIIITPSPENIAANCRKYGNNPDFSKQIMSITWGGKDTLTTPEMARANIEAMKLVYGIKGQKSQIGLPASSTMKEFADANGRIRLSEIEIPGIAHDWPTTSNSFDYPALITDWFFKNNMLLDQNQPPVISLDLIRTTLGGQQPVQVIGKITDDGKVTAAKIELLQGGKVLQSELLNLAGDGSYNKTYALADGSYVVRVSATDDGTPALTTDKSSPEIVVSTAIPEAPGKPVSCGVTASTICLQWTAAKGAAAYNVNFAGTTNSAAANVSGTTVTISGLAADTPYAFEVKGYNINGTGPAVASDPIRTATAITCNNHEGYFYTHLYAKRIYRVYKNFVTSYYLTGSNTPVKYSFSKMTLSETRPGHFELGACPAPAQ